MNASEIIRRAIEIGKATEEITFDQLNELCPSDTTPPEIIEQLLEALSDEGINVVEA
ncbi:RNA polymerase subunit sigma-70 [Bradyrhizobium sp. ISRA442]|uniref:RNA polymerase sigma factor region1.1 domain-containing protein n=1 Tax=Bradyrhizobium sp. ISRA442 TaxID=2866197 RepID=UPI00311B2011